VEIQNSELRIENSINRRSGVSELPPATSILPTMPKGWFITFEGGEGTGKSTQLGLLDEWLRTLGHSTVLTREPGGTPLAEAVRALLLDPELAPDGLSEIFLLEAARRDHVERVIRPALGDGNVVLCDRFTDSSLVYQGVVRGLGWEEVARLNRLATGGLDPALTLVFDMDPKAALARAHTRNSEGTGRESRLDDEPTAFHRKVREGFLELARREPDRVRVIDAAGRPEKVFARIHPVLPEALR
jgi:dTMP kinase